MKATLKLQNLNCEGCKSDIAKQLKTINGLQNLSIDIESSSISFNYKSHNTFEGIREALDALGYPIKSEKNTMVDRAIRLINRANLMCMFI